MDNEIAALLEKYGVTERALKFLRAPYNLRGY